MTRSEFIQKAAIAMAGNGNFTSSDCTLYSRSILHCAVMLYNEVEKETYFQDDEVEEDKSLLTQLSDIAYHLEGIKKAMEAPNGGELSTFQEMVNQLDRLTTKVADKMGSCLCGIEDMIGEKGSALIEQLDDIRKGTDCIGEPVENEYVEGIAGDLTLIKNALEDIRDSVADE